MIVNPRQNILSTFKTYLPVINFVKSKKHCGKMNFDFNIKEMEALRIETEDKEAKLWKQIYDAPTFSEEKKVLQETHSIIYKQLYKMEMDAIQMKKPSSEFVNNDLLHQKLDLHFKITKEKPYSVVIILDKSIVHVPMSKEEMIDYEAFINAIQLHIPEFNKARDFGWQHWQTIREAWNIKK